MLKYKRACFIVSFIIRIINGYQNGPPCSFSAEQKVQIMKRKKSTPCGPLNEIRILDLTRLYPGPLGAMLLADMGADVIKIEDIKSPDYMRFYPPYLSSESAGFLAVNRSKRSIALDLGKKKGRDVFFSLLKTADIVMEQFRPGILDKMGLGYLKARKIKRDIIYISITGYGQSGPYAAQAGHDINYIGYAGILAATGSQDKGPSIPGVQIADVAGGAYMTVIACLAALWARERTGKGQKADVSMLDAILPLMTLQMAHYQAAGIVPQAGQAALSGGLACYNVYQCADGKHVALGALEEKFWRNFCGLMQRPQWLDKQFVVGKEADDLRQEIAALFHAKKREGWLSLAKGKDVCLTPVLEIHEMENDPQIKKRGMIVTQKHPQCGKIKGFGVPLKFSATPATPSQPAPALGKHTAEIMKEIGYGQKDINNLKKECVIFLAEKQQKKSA